MNRNMIPETEESIAFGNVEIVTSTEAATSTALEPATGTFDIDAPDTELINTDIRLPYLRIVYGVGKLATIHNPGDIVLGEETVIYTRQQKTPLSVIVLKAAPYWKEYITQEKFKARSLTPRYRPRTFATEEEVHKAGETTTWKNNVGPTFAPALRLVLMIKQPDPPNPALFSVDIGGDLYALGVWYVDKTAYKRVSPPIIFTARTCAKTNQLLTKTFNLSTTITKINDNTTVVPVFQIQCNTPPELIAEIKQFWTTPF